MPYIPRSSIAPSGSVPKIVKKKHTFRVFGFIGTIMILVSLASVVFSFSYKYYALSELDNARQELINSSSVDVTSDIDELIKFDNKLSFAQLLIENHLAPTKIFKTMEASTKGTVQFLTLEYSYDPGFQALLELEGATKELTSVALQNIAFMKDDIFNEYAIQEINSTVDVLSEIPDTTEKETNKYPVSFSVKGEIKKESFAYTGMDNLENTKTNAIDDVIDDGDTSDQKISSPDADILNANKPATE